MSYDVIVIGSGPGGYIAAVRAAELGLKAACAEKRDTLGGTCLNVGCIPSKALLYSTEHLAFLKNQAKEHGIKAENVQVDLDKMREHKSEAVGTLTKGIESLFKAQKVDWLKGEARFLTPTKIAVGEKEFEAKNFIIASGSESVTLPFLPVDEKKILTSTGALNLEKIPERLAVIGGGAIGLEIGSIYARLGSKVTVIEMLDEIAAGMDTAISKRLKQILEKQGITFYTGTKVTRAEIKDSVKIFLDKEEIEADAVLVAVGRKPNTQGLNLEKLGVRMTDRGFIAVNDRFQTSVPNIYAIGDAIEGPMLAHKASDEGMAVAEILAKKRALVNYMTVANVIYTSPEAASVGLTEKEAKDLKIDVLISNCSYKAISRAVCTGSTEGFIKVIADKASQRILGVHILGQQASELIIEGGLAIGNKATLEDIVRTSHPHPTLTEGFRDACLNALSKARR